MAAFSHKELEFGLHVTRIYAKLRWVFLIRITMTVMTLTTMIASVIF